MAEITSISRDRSCTVGLVDIEVAHPRELGKAEFGRWREIQASDPRFDNPFLTPEFAVAFGNHRDDARVAVIRDGGRVTGFFPYTSRRGIAQSLGYDLADRQGLILDASAEIDFGELLTSCKLAVFEFDDFILHQGETIGAHRLVAHPSPIIEFDNGWDAWLQHKKTTSKSRIKRALEKQRKLAREVGALSFDYDDRSHETLELLMRWKSSQYVRYGRPDRFARSWLRELTHELLDTRTDWFGIRLSRLRAGNETVAVLLSPRSSSVLASWFPAFSTDFAKYSPGMLAMLALVEAASNDGLSKIDLGKGKGDYKESLKTGDETVAAGWVERRVPRAYVRRAVQAPKRIAIEVVVGNPHLARAARITLKKLGTARAKLNR